MAVLRAAVETSDGRLVDRAGEEILCAYPTPAATVLGAVQLQDALAEARESGALPTVLGIRIGLHYGPVLIEEHRLFGDTLYTVTRLCGLAKGHQILTTGETVRTLPDRLRAVCRLVEGATLKGRYHTSDVYRFLGTIPN